MLNGELTAYQDSMDLPKENDFFTLKSDSCLKQKISFLESLIASGIQQYW